MPLFVDGLTASTVNQGCTYRREECPHGTFLSQRRPCHGGGLPSWTTDKGLERILTVAVYSAGILSFHRAHLQGRPEVNKDPWLLSWSRVEMAGWVLFASVPSEGPVCCLSVPVVYYFCPPKVSLIIDPAGRGSGSRYSS